MMDSDKKKNKPAIEKRKRDLNAELLQALNEIKHTKWARKTELSPKPDGSVHRLITRKDGTMEKDHIISVKKVRNDSFLRTRKIRLSFRKKTFSDSADLIREDRIR